MLGVLAVAGTLFAWQREHRTAELHEQYARSVAHFGRQVELEFKAYRTVVDSLTPVEKQGSEAAAALARTVEEQNAERVLREQRKVALARAQEAAQTLGRAENRHEQSKQALSRAAADQEQSAGSSAEARNKADAALTAAKQAVATAGQADAEAKAARQAAVKAEQSASEADKKASVLTEARASLKTARKRFERQRAKVVGLPQQRTQAEKAEGDEDDGRAELNILKTKVDTAARRVDTAGQDATQAATIAKTLQREADEAQSAAKAAESEAKAAERKARALRRDFLKATKREEEAKQQQAAAKAQEQQVGAELGRQQQRVAVASRDLETAREALQRIRSQTEASEGAADELLQRFLTSALPSHRDALLQCLDFPAREARGECLLKAVARLNGLEQGLDFIACPEQQPTRLDAAGWLSNDRRSIVLPLRRSGDVSAGCAELPLDRIFSPSSSLLRTRMHADTPGRLSEVVLLSRDGVVLASSGQSGMRLRQLPGYEPENGLASQVLEEVPIGTGNYRIYLQPVHADVAIGCGAGQPCRGSEPPGDSANTGLHIPASGLVVAGLIKEDQLLAETLELSPTWFLWLLLLVGLAVFSLPLAKLWFLGPNARYGRYDATLLSAAAGVATLLFAICALAFFADDRLEQRADQRLKEVGTQVSQLLEQRLSKAAVALYGFAQNTRNLQSALDANADANAIEEHCRGGNGETGGVTLWGGFDDRAKEQRVCEVTNYAPSGSGPNFNLAVWMNARGDQLAKFARGEHSTTPVAVAHRGYFRDAMRRRFGCFGGETREADPSPVASSNGSNCGAVEVIRAVTTGETLLAVSRPTFAGDPDGGTPRGVAVWTERLSTFNDIVLPRALQVAVVDGEGDVMLHSDMGAQHGHNIFDDVDDPGRLRAVLNARLTDFIETHYLGIQSRMRVEYFPGADWFVISIAPRATTHALTSDMALVTGVGYGFFGLAVLVVLGFVAFFAFLSRSRRDESRRQVLLRPDARFTERYAVVGAIGLSVALLTFAACVVLPWFDLALFPMTALLGVVCLTSALSFLLLRLRKAERTGKATETSGWGRVSARVGDFASDVLDGLAKRFSWSKNLSLTYTLWCFSLIGLFVIAPATIIFQSAYDHVVANTVRAEQAHYVRAVDDVGCLDQDTPGTRCPVVVQSSDVKTSKKPRKANRRSETRRIVECVYAPLPCLAKVFPPLGSQQYADGLLYLVEQNLGGAGWDWMRAASIIDLQLSNGGRMESRVPGLFDAEGRAWSSAALLFALLAFSLVSFALAYHSGRKLYFVNVLEDWTNTECVDAKRLLAPGADDSVLVIFAHASLVEDVAGDDTTVELLLEGDASAPPATSSKTHFIRDFDEFLSSPGGPERIASALDAGTRVLAFSERDPLSQASEETLAQRAKLLQRFDVRSAEPHEDGRLSQTQALPAHMALVWSECSPDERRVLGEAVLRGFVTPHPSLVPTLQQLSARGLLNPETLTLPSRSFEEFIRGRVSRKDLEEWTPSQEAASTWDRMKAPLVTAVLVLCAALGISEPELAATGIVAPTFAAGLPGMLRLIAAVAGVAAGGAAASSR